MKNSKLKICLAASAGGHLVQLLKLSPCFENRDCFSVTTSNSVTAKLEKFGQVYIVPESNRQHPLKALGVLVKCFKIIIAEKPDVIISTGALHGCLLCIFAKFFGAKIIWVDSIANCKKLSLSGRIIRPFADLIFSQWQDVAGKYNKVQYSGSLV